MKLGDEVTVQPEAWAETSKRFDAKYVEVRGRATLVRHESGKVVSYPHEWIFRRSDVAQAYVYEHSKVPSCMVWLKRLDGTRGSNAVTLGPFVFLRGKANPEVLRHELIHVKQGRELLYLGFFIAYALQAVYRLIRTRSVRKAYRSLPFEVEAHANDTKPGYLAIRKRFAWARKG